MRLRLSSFCATSGAAQARRVKKVVGVAGFEPATGSSQSFPSTAEVHPDDDDVGNCNGAPRSAPGDSTPTCRR